MHRYFTVFFIYHYTSSASKRSTPGRYLEMFSGARTANVGKICERGRSWAGSERGRELGMVTMVSWQS